MTSSVPIVEPREQMLCKEISRRLKLVLDLFRRITDEPFLVPLRDAIAALQNNGFAGVSHALEGIESTFRRGSGEIEGFLASYRTIPALSNVPPDEAKTLRFIRLTDKDIDFLLNASSTMHQMADLLHECSIACKRDDLSISEVSDEVSSAAMSLLRLSKSFVGAEVLVLPLLVSMWTPGCSINHQGKLVKKMNEL